MKHRKPLRIALGAALLLLTLTVCWLAGCEEASPVAPSESTPAVTDGATAPPIAIPTETDTDTSSDLPTVEPAVDSTDTPTEVPTELTTEPTTEVPTEVPTEIPTETPTEVFTEVPTEVPTEAPTEAPTETPTDPPTEPPTEAPSEIPDAPPEGHEIGNTCYDATLTLFNGETYQVSEGRGGVTVLNFWGSWCGPCKNELPGFDQLASEYPEQVTIVAVHSAYGTAAGKEYVRQNYPQSAILFAEDPNSTYYDLVARDSVYPITVILDANGVIRYRFVGSISYNTLKNVLTNLLP